MTIQFTTKYLRAKPHRETRPYCTHIRKVWPSLYQKSIKNFISPEFLKQPNPIMVKAYMIIPPKNG